MDVCCSSVNNYGAESYYGEGFDHLQLWNSSPVLLQMQLDELNMIMESIDSPYQIPTHSPFSNKTGTTDSRSSSMNELYEQSSLSSSSSSMTSRANHGQRAGISHGHAFQPYKFMNSAVMKNRKEKTVVSQNMMKKVHSMLRNINLLKDGRKRDQELKPADNHKQHMASERRRRERLNEGYHSLRKLLPPGSKKDKTSVLRKTISCIQILKTEVYELQKENQIIQQHHYIFSGEQVEVQMNNRFDEEASEPGLIDLVVMVKVPCNLVQVVLRILECIRERRDLSLLRLDAGPSFTHEMSVSASLKLVIQGSTWNERTFKELITGAAVMALST